MSKVLKSSSDFSGQGAPLEAAPDLQDVREAFPGTEALLREAVSLKERIRDLQSRLSALEERIATLAEFAPGSKTGKLVAGNYRATVQTKENIRWGQEKLERLRSHIGDKAFFGLFRREYKPVNMRAIHAAMLTSELRDALQWAMTIRPAKPYIRYEVLNDAPETDNG